MVAVDILLVQIVIEIVVVVVVVVEVDVECPGAQIIVVCILFNTICSRSLSLSLKW